MIEKHKYQMHFLNHKEHDVLGPVSLEDVRGFISSNKNVRIYKLYS